MASGDALPLTVLEPPTRPLAGWRRFRQDIGPLYAANGLIGFIFAATGPVAVILAVGLGGGLSEAQLASWIFGSFFLNGLLSIAFCLLYQRPLVFFWTIPGTVLVGPALTHLSFAEVTGAFIATGVFMLALGLLGWVKRLMEAIPMAIVMGMVAGVFLRFGTDLVFAVRDDWSIAVPMIVTFLVLSALPAAGRRMPPVIGALLVGALLVLLGLGSGQPQVPLDAAAAAGTRWFAAPLLQVPAFSVQAMVELVLPLAITVLIVQNGQGIAVLSAAGHATPINAVTTACGAMSIVTGLVGTVSTCLTGPTNALISSSGERSRHYAAGVVVGILALAFGLLSPLFTRLMLATPPAFIAALAGLAMLRVLQAAFVTAFKARFSLGAMVAFIVTVAEVPILNIGAPFWGLVFGFLASALLERADFSERS
ncbi:MAG: benzoate transporter [Burkholderiaceae bacterium]|nr:benzoate transporter [Burkholderiaceae bacterium]